jgi:hypothetical protein
VILATDGALLQRSVPRALNGSGRLISEAPPYGGYEIQQIAEVVLDHLH